MVPVGSAVFGERRPVAGFHGDSGVQVVDVGRRFDVRLVLVERIVDDADHVRMSSCRVMYSVIVYMSLVCGPPRFKSPSLRCVVVILTCSLSTHQSRSPSSCVARTQEDAAGRP